MGERINPFNPATVIEFRILKVFDVFGREVATLVNEAKEPGIYTFQWDASGVSSGVYFHQVKAGTFVQMKRMIVVR